MRRWIPLLALVVLQTGCAALNDSLVRMWHQDRRLGSRVKNQIREGLERRMAEPERVLPRRPAPAFLDQG